MTQYEVTFNLSHHSYIIEADSEKEAEDEALKWLGEDLQINLNAMIKETTVIESDEVIESED